MHSEWRDAHFIFVACERDHSHVNASQWYLNPVCPTTGLRLSCFRRQTNHDSRRVIWGHKVSHMLKVGEHENPQLPSYHCPPIAVQKRVFTRQLSAHRILCSDASSSFQSQEYRTRSNSFCSPRNILNEDDFIMRPSKFLLSLLSLAGCGLASSQELEQSQQSCPSTVVDPVELVTTFAVLTSISQYMGLELLQLNKTTTVEIVRVRLRTGPLQNPQKPLESSSVQPKERSELTLLPSLVLIGSHGRYVD